MKNGKIANLNVTLKELFKYWLLTTKRYNRLAPREIDVVSLFLYYRYVYSKDILNEKLLWRTVFDYDTRMLIKEELGMEDSQFQNILTDLRNKNIIVNNVIRSVYIPSLEHNSKNFKLIFNYNIIDNG